MSDTAKLQERLDFYQTAYNDTSVEVKSILNNINLVEPKLKQYTFNMVDQLLGNELIDEERKLLEEHFGFNFLDLDKKFSKIKSEREKEISVLKSDPRYEDYLALSVDDDLELVIKLEKDETFNYLIEQNFHNNEFVNEPYFEILKFKYQPRFWKFKNFANKKAVEMGFQNYSEMFQIWTNLRINFKSLIGDKRIEEVVKESEALQAQIKEIEDKILNISSEYLEAVKSNLSDILLHIEESKFGVFNDPEEVKNILSVRGEYNSNKKNHETLNIRLNSIMDNVAKVEELIYAVEKGHISIDNDKFNSFFINNDPTVPIFQLIPDIDWEDLKTAFAKKGIQLKDKSKYTKVETKLTNVEKESILKEYGVKEGEIFIDKNLAGKRFKVDK